MHLHRRALNYFLPTFWNYKGCNCLWSFLFSLRKDVYTGLSNGASAAGWYVLPMPDMRNRIQQGSCGSRKPRSFQWATLAFWRLGIPQLPRPFFPPLASICFLSFSSRLLPTLEVLVPVRWGLLKEACSSAMSPITSLGGDIVLPWSSFPCSEWTAGRHAHSSSSAHGAAAYRTHSTVSPWHFDYSVSLPVQSCLELFLISPSPFLVPCHHTKVHFLAPLRAFAFAYFFVFPQCYSWLWENCFACPLPGICFSIGKIIKNTWNHTFRNFLGNSSGSYVPTLILFVILN